MPAPRTLLGLLVGFAVSWLGALILGEYPFTGFTPVIGGFLLGVSVVSAMAYVEGQDPPRWAIVVGAALAVWGIWRAARIDAGAHDTFYGLLPGTGAGPLPTEAWWAVVAAAAGAAVRLIPARDRSAAAGETDDTGEPAEPA